MLNRFSIIALVLVLFFVASCVSKKKYMQLETELNNSQAQVAEGNNQLNTLQARNNMLRDENGRLIKAIEDLKLELQQEKMAVQRREREITKKEKEITKLDKTRKEIEDSLKEQIAQKDIKLEEIEGKLKVTFVDKILFDSGSVRIKPKGKEVLLKLAESFQEDESQNIVVEGHTDDVQIGSALQDRFPTNWELSAARATAVARFLQDDGTIDPQRLTASGFSFYRPVETNETEEGRKQNRRIEIILIPKR